MSNHIQVEKVSTNLTVRRCLGCGDAGGSNPNAEDADKLAFAGWFRFKHKECADKVAALKTPSLPSSSDRHYTPDQIDLYYDYAEGFAA